MTHLEGLPDSAYVEITQDQRRALQDVQNKLGPIQKALQSRVSTAPVLADARRAADELAAAAVRLRRALR